MKLPKHIGKSLLIVLAVLNILLLDYSHVQIIFYQIIEISLSQYESPWEDSWGVAFGRFQYSHPASVTTDSIGKFKIPITVNIVPIGHDGYKCFQSLIPGQSSEPNPDVTQILVDVRISKTQIVGGGSLVINNFICDYRHWGLIF